MSEVNWLRIRRRPTEVEAIRLTEENAVYLAAALDGMLVRSAPREPWDDTMGGLVAAIRSGGLRETPRPVEALIIETADNGWRRVNVGAYIIRNANGKRDFCEPDIFEQTYEALGDPMTRPPLPAPQAVGAGRD